MRGEDVVVVRVGKKGLTDEVLAEIDGILSSRGIVKVKLLKNFREAFEVDRGVREMIANEIATKLGAVIIDVRGYTVILKRPKGRKRQARGF